MIGIAYLQLFLLREQFKAFSHKIDAQIELLSKKINGDVESTEIISDVSTNTQILPVSKTAEILEP